MKDEHSFVIEIKTTDAYRIDLERVASYSEKLIERGVISAGKKSILIVVGRKDTGDLESQIRGSRHFKDIRLISIKALTTLLRLKEQVNNTGIHRQISEVLKPVEYTKLDGLIELMFNPSSINQIEIEEEIVPDTVSNEPKPTIIPDKVRRISQAACIEKISENLKTSFIKKSNSAFLNPEHNTGFICMVSKIHQRKQAELFWYSFYPYQENFLKECRSAYVAFICGDEKTVILLPFDKFIKLTANMSTTKKGMEIYWHINIYKTGDKFEIQQPRSKTKQRVDVTKYLIE